MEQKFGINSIDVKLLRDFCEQEGESIQYQKVSRWSVRSSRHSGSAS